MEIEAGRVAKLSLRGCNGALDLYVCYFPTGPSSEENKRQLIQRLSEHLAPREHALTILMGDWNFVMMQDDRFCLRTLQSTGHTDSPTAKQFEDFLNNHHLHELEQPMFTHENTTAYSRLDRIYVNHHVADQLDRHFSVSALKHTKLSTHRPIAFSRQSKATDTDNREKLSFPCYILHHPNWKRDLLLNYEERIKADSFCSNLLRRFEVFKDSMWEVASTLKRETPPEATTTEDKLAWTMIFIRAAEAVKVR